MKLSDLLCLFNLGFISDDRLGALCVQVFSVVFSLRFVYLNTNEPRVKLIFILVSMNNEEFISSDQSLIFTALFDFEGFMHNVTRIVKTSFSMNN